MFLGVIDAGNALDDVRNALDDGNALDIVNGGCFGIYRLEIGLMICFLAKWTGGLVLEGKE